MEALYIQPRKEDGLITEEKERGESAEQEAVETEALSPLGSTTDEDTDEDSEPEPPPVARRKVSFADAFGLNLVSVKEFDNVDVTEQQVDSPPESEATCVLEEFHMICLFTVPSSQEELDQRLQEQKVELESIELLPGTTTLRGIIRVLNLCYSKYVYVRISLDCWNSYFDMMAEYVPGSSDRKTDRFSFKYTLIPPSGKERTRVDFCLRYETSVGMFWANNKEMNYVLFCHKKGPGKEHGRPEVEENNSYKGKRSCLKLNRRGSAVEKAEESINTTTVSAEALATHYAEEAVRKIMDNTEIQSLLYHEEHKPLVDSIKTWHRTPRLARVQDSPSQRRQAPKTYSHDFTTGQKVSQPTTAAWSESASALYNQRKKPIDSPQVLTYHQIPLLTLDWKSEKPQPWGAADVDDIWNESAKPTKSKAFKENTPSISDLWETFLSGTDDTSDKETSVCDIWQTFLNEPSCKDHSGVPESEWLQTATSVSPSNHKEPHMQYLASSQAFQEFQLGLDTATSLQAETSTACHPPSDKCEASLSDVALNTEALLPAEARVSGPRDDNRETQDASRRSQTTSATDTSTDTSLQGAMPVSGGTVDSSAECHKHAIWERAGEGIIGVAEGIGGDEPVTLYTANLVTSSGELKTTDMTAMPESQNASSVDMISQGARLDEGLSSSGEEEVTGTAHNTTDDTLAFRKTIRQGTTDGETVVFSTSRQRAVEKIMTNCMENKVSTAEEIFRPHKTGGCEISQSYADEKHGEEFRLNRKNENPLQENERDENEIRPAQSHAHEFNPSQTCEENIRPSLIMGNEFKLNESENKGTASGNKDLVGFRQAQVENSFCAQTTDTKGPISAESEVFLVEEARQHNEKALQINSSDWQEGDAPIIAEVHNKHSRPNKAEEDLYAQKEEEEENLVTVIQKEENALKPRPGEYESVSNQAEGAESLSCSGIIVEQQETHPSLQSTHSVEIREGIEVLESDRNTVGPFPADECNQNVMRVVSSQNVTEGRREIVGSEMSPGGVAANENLARRDTQHQPETIERIEDDVSQTVSDERMSIGKLEIEARDESMGHVEDPQWGSNNVSDELKEVENPTRVEYRELSEGTKDPITAESTVAREVEELRVEEIFIERFGEDLVRRIWEEVFSRKVQDTNIIIPDSTHNCNLLCQEGNNSGVFSPEDQSLRLCRGPEQTTASGSKELSPTQSSHSLIATNKPHFGNELQTDFNLSAHLSRDLTATLTALSRQSLAESAQSTGSPKNQENCSQIRKGSVIQQQTGRQREDCSGQLKEPNGLVWWSIYMLTHITRLLMCTLLVVGFFVTLFLFDFPAFCAAYMFSLCWWFYKWKTHRAEVDKDTSREFAERREGVQERFINNT
ncbi:uncharacterized protein ppp1r3aa [Solea solea]|uniref:uncharacterized protein ppp1r3aa n=1 Tax=Solea solea TaxID=90069 RepID=UPI00272B7A74|nr:uncharacterized protein ppp1r3aa [Solea solea]